MKVIVLICAVAAVFAAPEPEVHTCDEKPDSGMCLAYMPMYYYDASSGTCKRFIYGGCQGNGNRYGTEESCLEHCSDVQAALDRPDCEKAPETGLCKAYIPRFYYDQDAGMCKSFIYGGCGGNRNNFKSEDECYNKCGALSAPTACQQDKAVGVCRGYFLKFYYNKVSGKCEAFIYGGCGGNDNNFNNQEDCEGTCSVSHASSKCSAEPETGMCRGSFPHYYYDQLTKSCKSFIYGGCGGNENNYETVEDCEKSCAA